MLRPSNPIASLRRFARAREGATAVEFAFVAIPLLTLIFGVIELGMVMLVSATLDTATEFAARDIRTGIFQSGGQATAAEFKQKVCRNMSWLKDSCASQLTVEAETFSTFTNVGSSQPADPATFNPNTPRCWSVGAPEDIVLIRTYYSWPLFTPLLNASLENAPGSGKRLITAAKAFRNEPYNNTQNPVGAKCT